MKAFDLYILKPEKFRSEINNLIFEVSNDLTLFAEHYTKLIQKNHSLRLQKRHLLYSPDCGPRFLEAKDNFNKLLKTQTS